MSVAGVANLFSVECQYSDFQSRKIFGVPRQNRVLLGYTFSLYKPTFLGIEASFHLFVLGNNQSQVESSRIEASTVRRNLKLGILGI